MNDCFWSGIIIMTSSKIKESINRTHVRIGLQIFIYDDQLIKALQISDVLSFKINGMTVSH